MAMIGRIRKARYDRVYDLQTNSRTNWYFQLLRPFPPQWSGIAFGCALPQKGKARLHMHTLERQADQLRAAGIWPDAQTEPGSAPPPDLSWILRKHKERAPSPAPPRPSPTCCWCPAARPTGPRSVGRSSATLSWPLT
jgi:ADP-heptose:LPS heptosyltransferase